MDYKTKRTVLSSSVIISSLVICLVCVVVVANAFGGTGDTPSLNTPEPADGTPSATVSTAAPVTTPPVVTSGATPTQTYHNSPYTTGPQGTQTPDVTISVTETPQVTEQPITADATLTYFNTKLIAFNDSTATYTITMGFNAAGTVRVVAVDSNRNLTTTDINPNFIRSAVNGANRNYLSTPNSVVSGVAEANTNLTLQIETGLNPVDFFLILDTDVENGLMSNSIVQKYQGSYVPTIESFTTPVVSGTDLVFDVVLTQDATVYVQVNGNTLKQDTTGKKASFSIPYDASYAGGSLEAYIEYKGIKSASVRTLMDVLPSVEQTPENTELPVDESPNPSETTENTENAV